MLSGNWPTSVFYFSVIPLHRQGNQVTAKQPQARGNIWLCTGNYALSRYRAYQYLPRVWSLHWFRISLPWNNTKIVLGEFCRVLCYSLLLLSKLVYVEVGAKTRGPCSLPHTQLLSLFSPFPLHHYQPVGHGGSQLRERFWLKTNPTNR